MSRYLLLTIMCLAMTVAAVAQRTAQPKVYQYRIYLADKHGTPYKLKHPEKFLSKKSIERRHRQGLGIDSTDLPVSPYYIKQLQGLGLTIMGGSKWHNTAWVASPTDDVAAKVSSLPFVRRVVRLYESPDSAMLLKRDSVVAKTTTDSVGSHGRYGSGYWQISQLRGISLHDKGFRGKGMTIAILDAGFHNADSIAAFDNINVVGTADFGPNRHGDIFSEHYHGTMVLSTMAMNRPGVMIGTAPDAAYVLIRTEDNPTETMAEEDSWTMGAEFADSIGADLINSSLGYYHWDGDTTGLNLRDLDGHTTFISQTASMLAKKGIVLCNSAGNEGMGPWHKISAPADAYDILAVGAVERDGEIAMFSSLGPSQDCRVKPDICAMGSPAYVVNGRGEIETASGTSFSSPIMCGMVACLWQANPTLTACEIIDLVRSLGDRAKWPDSVYGYGIPDFAQP